MRLETFFEKFDQFADAPDAVAKMRELVLQLAVRGKLSEQKPSESPHAQLEIAEAFRLLRRRSFEVNPEDGRFSVPDNWGWVPVGAAMDMVNGKAFKPEEWSSEGTPIIRIQNLNNENAPFNRCSADVDAKIHVHNGDFLISWSGTPGTSFGAFIWNRGFAFLNQHIFRCELVEGVFKKEYLRLAVNARLDEMISHAHGGAGLRHITKGNLESIALPLPPLGEQKRIVAKVDELMALCDRLEAQQKEWEKRHAALTHAAIRRFDEAPTPANLNFLFHPSCSVIPSDLRKTILNLAVRGKLVPQDPADESVTELIQRIEQVRSAVHARVYPAIEPSEVPFEIPFAWSWVRLGNIALNSDSGWSPQCDPQAREGDAWGVLKVSAVSWGRFLPEENKALPLDLSAREECEVKAGDFLISRANTEDLVARSVVVIDTPPHLMMSDKIVRFAFPDFIDKFFINLVNSATFAREHYSRNASGTSSSMKNVGREVMSSLPVPLPPLTEQRRIVAKTNALFALLDKMEEMITSSRSMANDLADAIVGELVKAGGE